MTKKIKAAAPVETSDKHAIQIERDKRRVRNMKVKRGTARAKRRAQGNYTPVNTLASVTQHPGGRYANGPVL